MSNQLCHQKCLKRKRFFSRARSVAVSFGFKSAPNNPCVARSISTCQRSVRGAPLSQPAQVRFRFGLWTHPASSQISSRRLSIGPAMSATMAIKLIERNAHVCFKLITRTMITWKASGSENKKQYGNQLFHLITLSARASTLGGIVRPICFAVLKLMMNSNLVGCSTGMSAGLAPFKILST
jgi:hypothetical protein